MDREHIGRGFHVLTNDSGGVSIAQDRPFEQMTHVVDINPGEIDLLINWLRQAQVEIEYESGE